MSISRRFIIGLVAAVAIAPTSLTVKAQNNIDTAVSAGQFETLVAAIKAAGLVDTRRGNGPFTVFAPTDAAFAALPDGTVESLLKPEDKDPLNAILTCRLIPGRVMSGDIAGKTAKVATVQGSKLSINATSGVKVDNGIVTAADIEASTGVIHLIDTAVLPN